MKTLLKALIGGVVVQLCLFVLLLVGVVMNLDKLLPTVAKVMGIAFLLTAPGVLLLLREGEPQANRGLLLATGVIIDILLYSLVVYVILLLRNAVKRLS
jgi:Kef-type K+ transport system membrane component KefB